MFEALIENAFHKGILMFLGVFVFPLFVLTINLVSSVSVSEDTPVAEGLT